MKILISNTSDTPLYQQIKDQIKDAILKEELVEGDALQKQFYDLCSVSSLFESKIVILPRESLTSPSS